MHIIVLMTVFLLLALPILADRILNPTALYMPNTILTNNPTSTPSQNPMNSRYTIIHNGADICNYMQPDYLSWYYYHYELIDDNEE